MINIKLPLLIFLASSTIMVEAVTKPDSESELQKKLASCYSADWKAPASIKFTVNGHTLSKTQQHNVLWVKDCILPLLSGSLEERLTTVARTSWWALREGIFDLAGHKIFRYSNCHEGGKDRFRSNIPLYACPGSIWQVGIGAAQVMNYSPKIVADKRIEIFGENISESDVLGWTAILAGFPAGSSVNQAIRNSAGKVRRSWLMRNPHIAFQLVADTEVKHECLIDRKRWCFGKGYPSAKKFSSNELSMRRSINDLRKIYQSSLKLKPGPLNWACLKLKGFPWRNNFKCQEI